MQLTKTRRDQVSTAHSSRESESQRSNGLSLHTCLARFRKYQDLFFKALIEKLGVKGQQVNRSLTTVNSREEADVEVVALEVVAAKSGMGKTSVIQLPKVYALPNLPTLESSIASAAIMDKSVATLQQNKRFLSASFRNFEKHLFLLIANPPPPLPLFNVAIRSVDSFTWLQH